MEGYHHNEEIASAMTTAVLEDMTTHFLAYRKSWARDGMTWYMFRQGREVRYSRKYVVMASSTAVVMADAISSL